MNSHPSDRKTCFKCGESRPRTEFYRHPMMGDGTLGKCKTCTRWDVKANREFRAEHYRLYDKRRGHRGDPAKAAVRAAVRREIASGRLVKPTHCEDCQTGPLYGRALQGHHEDYSKPLDVIWVCTTCHGLRHGSDVLSRLHQVITFQYDEETA